MSHDDLLERARSAAAVLSEAERQVLLARGEYHAAVRRLHLAGLSLREIAQALSMSHQRVQQIVDAAGGSWWRRVWRTRNATRDAVCTWCDRPASEVSKLIAGPDVYICDGCIAAAERVAAGAPAEGGALKRTKARTAGRCAFCGERPSETRTVVLGPANVCQACLRICREIVDSRTA